MARRGLSVEFVGLPGVGKSGVSRRLAEILKGQGFPVLETAYELTHLSGVAARRLRKSAHIARELARHPRYSGRSARAIGATKQSSSKDLLGAIANWLFVSNLLRHDGRAPEIHLLDEGIFQALWSVGFSAALDDLSSVARDIGSDFPVPDVVVIVNASHATVMQRLRARGVRQSRLEDRLGTDRGILERSDKLMRDVEKILGGIAKTRRNVHIHEMANDRENDLEPNARALAGVLIPMFEGLR